MSAKLPAAARWLAGVTRAVSSRRTGTNSADSDLVVRRFLDLSTAHLRHQTCDRLGSHEGLVAYRTAYGWLMYVSEDGDELAEEYDWPAELLPIITLARAHGCSYVLFDREARRHSTLAVFDWSSTPAQRTAP